MLKTISAALLAASVIVAPALAAESGKTNAPKPTQAATIKADQAQSKVATSAVKPADAKVNAKTDAKSKLLNANARMTRHRHHKFAHAHRHHHKVASVKVKTPLVKTHKVSAKHVTPANPVKRG